MKYTKMSLIAALLVTSSAFAIENTKVSGNTNLYYSTTQGNNHDMFNKDASAADASVNLNLTTDLTKNDLVTVSAGLGGTLISTLGLENNLVSNVFGASHSATANTDANYLGAAPFNGVKVEDAAWLNEAWMAATVGNTTAKIGRMELDTPLVFTEKWSIEKNTFESIAVINTDIPDTTLVGAYVGNGNGSETFGQNTNGTVAANNLAVAGVVNEDATFNTYGTNGAYAIGVINKSWKPLTAQAWYYNLTSLATAYWLQADLNIDGILAGAQYTSTSLTAGNAVAPTATDASGTFAIMAGYEMKDTFTAKLAYSQTSDKGVLHGANTATSSGASKLYTEAWWNYGQITEKDTSAINLTVESPVNGIVDLGLYVTMIDHSSKAKDADTKPLEATVTAGKSFGPLDVTAAYIYYDADTTAATTSTLQAYLTYNF
jgi:hypothetical protein